MREIKTIRIETGHKPPSMGVRGYKIFLGDADVSEFVKGFRIDAMAGMFPEITLYCHGMLELPDEITALMEVEIDDQEKVYSS